MKHDEWVNRLEVTIAEARTAVRRLFLPCRKTYIYVRYVFMNIVSKKNLQASRKISENETIPFHKKIF